MSILVFLVLLFGLFGVFISQYIMQYRQVYLLWTEEFIYVDNLEKNDHCADQKCNANNTKLCSSVESFCRELCSLTDIIRLLFTGICVTAVLALTVIKINIPLAADNYTLNILYSSQILIFLLLALLYLILKHSNIDIIRTSNTSEIDEKLFDLWCKFNCHECKNDIFKSSLVPRRMYEILAERIDKYEIEPKGEFIQKILSMRVDDKKQVPEDLFTLLV